MRRNLYCDDHCCLLPRESIPVKGQGSTLWPAKTGRAASIPIGGRYILQQKLGAGGMGAVFRATDRFTQQTVALKQVTTLHMAPTSVDNTGLDKAFPAILVLIEVSVTRNVRV